MPPRVSPDALIARISRESYLRQREAAYNVLLALA